MLLLVHRKCRVISCQHVGIVGRLFDSWGGSPGTQAAASQKRKYLQWPGDQLDRGPVCAVPLVWWPLLPGQDPKSESLPTYTWSADVIYTSISLTHCMSSCDPGRKRVWNAVFWPRSAWSIINMMKFSGKQCRLRRANTNLRLLK